MRKLSIIIAVCALVSSLFAIDTVRVIRSGNLIKTTSPIFAEVTTTTWNYTATGNITGNSIVSVTTIDAVTGNFSADVVAPTVYATQIYNTNLSTVKIVSDEPLTFGSSCPTAAATNVTANYSIPVTVNGVSYKMLLRL